MRPYRASAVSSAFPLRHMVGRASALLLLLAAVTLVGLGKTDRAELERLHAAVNDTLTPALDLLSRPVHSAVGASAWLQEQLNMRAEYAALKAEAVSLRQWRDLSVTLQAENEALRNQLHYAPPIGSTYVSARIVGDAGGPYVRSALINAGAGEGVRKGQAVVAEGTLVGRVTTVGRNSARVLLLTDVNSRVPVILEGTRERAIAAGVNGPLLALQYLPEGSKAKVGERVVTSGDGGLFPSGIVVGTVTAVGRSGVTVTPNADWATLEHVTAVDYPLDLAK